MHRYVSVYFYRPFSTIYDQLIHVVSNSLSIKKPNNKSQREILFPLKLMNTVLLFPAQARFPHKKEHLHKLSLITWQSHTIVSVSLPIVLRGRETFQSFLNVNSIWCHYESFRYFPSSWGILERKEISEETNWDIFDNLLLLHFVFDNPVIYISTVITIKRFQHYQFATNPLLEWCFYRQHTQLIDQLTANSWQIWVSSNQGTEGKLWD